MTDFAKTLQELCCRENISIKTALYNAVPHLNTNRLSERILTTDAIPDLTTITALAKYFKTGLDTFIPNYTLKTQESRVYLAGPITGVPDFMTRFSAAKAYLETKNRHVFSPAHVSSVLPNKCMTRKNFMTMGIFLLSMCEEIAMLPGWQTSDGCQMEMAYAQANNYPVIELSEGHIQDGLRILTEQKQKQ